MTDRTDGHGTTGTAGTDGQGPGGTAGDGSADAAERRWSTTVLVIGAGAAGLRTAIELADAGVQVTCVGKRRRDDAHTTLAAGGINAALATTDPDDDWVQHAADTLREGYYLSDPTAVETLARHSPQAIEELEAWGAGFNRGDDGRLVQRFFGAHTYRRTCFAGDYTGLALHRALLSHAQDLGVPIRDDLYVTRLLVHEGRVFGAYGFDVTRGRREVVLADAVVLAAGGHTRIWRRSSSRRDENTGDTMRLASLAGCRLQDMELTQFHPTGMVAPESAEGTLVTEAVRGEGGHLLNADGERFMQRYDPEREELSTRDRVAYANHTEIVEGRGSENGGVWLDVSQLDDDYVRERLPRMYRQFLELAMLDITREPMEVAPTCHYSMGGVRVEPATHGSDLAGLWAVGEASSGVHGANRLGGNSLGECIVFGRIVGQEVARYCRDVEGASRDHAAITEARDEVDAVLGNEGEEFTRPIQRALRDLMTRWCGVVRDEDGLRRGLEELAGLEDRVTRVRVTPDLSGYDDLVHAFDLHGSLLSARATLECALERRETRGAQIRSDHPDVDPAQQHNLLWTPAGITADPVGEPSGAVRERLGATSGELSTAGRLAE